MSPADILCKEIYLNDKEVFDRTNAFVWFRDEIEKMFPDKKEELEKIYKQILKETEIDTKKYCTSTCKVIAPDPEKWKDFLESDLYPDGPQELVEKGGDSEKLFWKQFSDLLAERNNVIALIDEVVAKLSSYQGVNQSLLGVLRKISIDQLKIDFGNSAALTKQEAYEITYRDYLLLSKKGLLTKTTKYDNGKMIVKYSYDKVRHDHFQGIMERFNRRSNLSRESINAALNLNLGANIQYEMVDA